MSRDMYSDPATIDESKINANEKRAHLERLQEIADVQQVMQTSVGRRVLARFIEMTGAGVIGVPAGRYLNDSGATDPHETFQMIGQHRLGEQIKGELLMLAPHEFGLMIKEHVDSIVDKEKTDAMSAGEKGEN